MNRDFYVTLNAWISSKKRLVDFIKILNSIVTAYMFILYPVMCLYFLLSKDLTKLIFAIILCGAGFVLVSLLRRVISRKRPYDELSYTPVLKSGKKANSMPSRHTYSVFVIALSSILVSPGLCAVNLLLGICLAFCRILGGVHYVSDIAAGVAIALAFGIPYFFI